MVREILVYGNTAYTFNRGVGNGPSTIDHGPKNYTPFSFLLNSVSAVSN